MQICDKCGLPVDLCICKEIAKEQQLVKVYTLKKKFGKIVTFVEGINEKEVDLKALSKELKSKFACGGTVKDGCIRLQGDKKKLVQKTLREMGYTLEGGE
ncbi:MAG: stress response translation initiation inhibitor YciH [Methanosarcinales archaeon]|nr:stress response translation initiation inhibitor YciH [Methanosarcinales archaeon]